MKSSLRLFCILLMSAGLILPACKDQSADESAESVEAELAEEEAEEAEEEAEEAEEEAEEAEDEAEEAEDEAEEAEDEAEEAEEEADEAAEEADEKQEEAAEKKAAAKPAQPALVGTLSGDAGGPGVSGAKLNLTVTKDYEIHGNYTGSAEDKNFRVPVSGKVDKQGAFNASGSKGQSNIRVTGNVRSAAIAGNIDGQIFAKPFKTSFTLSK